MAAENGRYGDPFGILYTLFTGFTLATIVIALLQLRQEARRVERARLDSAEDLARLFFEPDMKGVRDEVFAARVGWLRQTFDIAEFARYWVDREHPVGGGPSRTSGRPTEKDADGLPDPVPTSRLIGYYVALGHRLRALPEDSESQALKREIIRRYLWPYWRGYLMGLGRTVREEYEREVGAYPERKAQYPLVSWIADLEELDSLSGLPGYDRINHPYDRQHSTGTRGPEVA